MQRGREAARQQRAVDARRPVHRDVVHARHPKGDGTGRGHVHVHGGQRAGTDARGGTGAGRAVPAAGDGGDGAGHGAAARGGGGRERVGAVQRDREPGPGVGGVDPRRAPGLPAVRRGAAHTQGDRGLGGRVHVPRGERAVPVVAVAAADQPHRERVAHAAGAPPARRGAHHARPPGGHRGHRRDAHVLRVAARLAHAAVQVVARVRHRGPVDQRHHTGHRPEVHHTVGAPGQRGPVPVPGVQRDGHRRRGRRAAHRAPRAQVRHQAAAARHAPRLRQRLLRHMRRAGQAQARGHVVQGRPRGGARLVRRGHRREGGHERRDHRAQHAPVPRARAAARQPAGALGPRRVLVRVRERRQEGRVQHVAPDRT